jgi:NAD(P)-dependent dehydrogenase (short-subunit alcohol dehydrogenase family)
MPRTTIVTGAAQGIGRAIAECLASTGYEVHALDRNEQVVSEPPSGSRGSHVCDVSDPDQVVEAVRAVRDDAGPIDVLVSAAGVMTTGDAVSGTLQDWERAFAINARAPWLFAQQVIPDMCAAGGGAIVNISSAAGLLPNPQLLSYSASKAALVALTRSIALDYGKDGIRANTVCPGAVDTAMYRSTKPEGVTLAEHEAAIIGQYPMRRFGTVDEIAATVAFLVSDEAAYLTGAALQVDGGRTLH